MLLDNPQVVVVLVQIGGDLGGVGEGGRWEEGEGVPTISTVPATGQSAVSQDCSGLSQKPQPPTRGPCFQMGRSNVLVSVVSPTSFST